MENKNDNFAEHWKGNAPLVFADHWKGNAPLKFSAESLCYKRVPSFKVHCFFTGQYYTENPITFIVI